jgi:hypothetical protein
MIRSDVRNRLIDVARKRETINYGELMKEFGIGRNKIGGVVGEISNYEAAQGRPQISSIVVRSDSRTKSYPHGNPGGGFFGLDGIPKGLRRPASAHADSTLTSKEKEYIKREQERVWDTNWKKKS